MPTFCYSDNEGLFRNECEAESREAVALIAEEELGLVIGDAVWVGVREEVHPEVYIDVEHILETVGDGVYEVAGEVSEGWPYASKEDIGKLQEKLSAAFKAWMEETNNSPEFYVVGDVTRHVIGSVASDVNLTCPTCGNTTDQDTCGKCGTWLDKYGRR